MKIVVLDGYTLNPGDLSWSALQALGPCEIHDRSPADTVVGRAAAAEIILTNKVPLTRELIAALPKLRYIGVTATGYNIVDTVAARERNVVVTNIPAYGTRSVAQMTFALLLELCHHAGHHSQTVHNGGWSRSIDWCYWDHRLVELDGLTLGIVGFGRIGRAVAELALAFGMKVVATSQRPPVNVPAGVTMTGLDTLFATSDVVSLHCPLTPDTKQLVNATRLDRMKPTAFLINTSRGPLIDEAALSDALNAGRIAGAAVDVLSTEPPAGSNPLLSARNCIITPHIAWATQAARSRLMDMAVANVKAFLDGQPRNVVN
ncbi:MAG TPA: D-2-hydroxyacid dehydrogenase [Verrucomicrobiae bacterium]|nr:D-2-hydroxyacid dehydrogenase [Verrucomicrobiae bacterium]